MAKNGNGEGSIYPHKKNGKKVGYRGAYWVHTAEGPKRRYVSGKTRDEVHNKLIEALGSRAQGLVFDAGSLTVREYLTRWLEDSVRGTVRVSTYEVHRHMIQPHIVPALGRLKLKDIKPTHVRGLYREKLDSGLSASTVRKMHSILRKALKQAVLDGLIPRNVCDAVKPPKVERKEITPLDRQQTKTLLEAASGDRLEALYVLAVHTGMREGELLGLKWEDVDLKRGLLRLRHALVREGGKVVLGDLKTPKSRRSVRLTAVATDALREHLERQLAEMERMGSLYQPGGLVFATENGTLINPSNLRNRSFKPLMRRAGLPDICLHDLRHTCATLLLSWTQRRLRNRRWSRVCRAAGGRLRICRAITSVPEPQRAPECGHRQSRELWLGAAGALISPYEETGMDSEEEAVVMALELADWLGAVVGLVRGGVGASASPEVLVRYINECPEVEGTIEDEDTGVVEMAFELILPAWEATGAIDPHRRLTALGEWGLPRALVRAWGGDFEAEQL